MILLAMVDDRNPAPRSPARATTGPWSPDFYSIPGWDAEPRAPQHQFGEREQAEDHDHAAEGRSAE